MSDQEGAGQIKVGYLTLSGHTSTAYVSEDPPHRGSDKHSDEPLELVWDDEEDLWRQIPRVPAVHWDKTRAMVGDWEWVDDKGRPVYG